MLDPVTPTFLPGLQATIEVFAVIAFALSGLAAGLRVGMDFVGVCFVAGSLLLVAERFVTCCWTVARSSGWNRNIYYGL